MNGLMKDVHETYRVRKQEAAEDDADTVTIAKEDYETMIDDCSRCPKSFSASQICARRM